MKRLIVYLAHPTEAGRVDRIEVLEGVTLRDTSDARNRPFLPVGSMLRVELLDDEGAAPEATESRLPYGGTPVNHSEGVIDAA